MLPENFADPFLIPENGRLRISGVRDAAHGGWGGFGCRDVPASPRRGHPGKSGSPGGVRIAGACRVAGDRESGLRKIPCPQVVRPGNPRHALLGMASNGSEQISGNL